jgi:uncharacterized protein
VKASVKASATALLVLLASPACSAEVDDADAPAGPVMVQAALPEMPEGAVLDQADILPTEMEVALDEHLTRFWRETGDALLVVSVNSLSGETIDNYAFTMFNTWGIGDRMTDRGLLILIAPNERQVRIEVGCGLESIVSDKVAADVIQQRMLPGFRQGAFANATQSGVDALIERLARQRPANDPGPQSELCRAEKRKAA